MTRVLALVVLMLFTQGHGKAADPVPYLKASSMPFYPSLARQARIEGSVLVRFVVGEDGKTSSVEAMTGQKLLRQTATEIVGGWQFGWPQPCVCKVAREVEVLYRLSGKVSTPKSPTVTVRWFGTSKIEVKADLAPIQYEMTN